MAANPSRIAGALAKHQMKSKFQGFKKPRSGMDLDGKQIARTAILASKKAVKR